MARYIFVTGGVVSSLGKGLSSASLAYLLKSQGYKVRLRKMDPYLNVDPGTMSPFQHGEVFVTNDGAETDLDLGHYERFTNISAKKSDNITTGKIYSDIIKKERQGKYLGKTVQVIPHVTDRIRDFIKDDITNEDFVICEIGGTVGDIESLPFVEAIRQFSNEVGRSKSLFIHLTFVPFLKSSDEIKTKPTQHSVKELRSLGIQPDIIICRSQKSIPLDQRKKISLFCNVSIDNVIETVDVRTIYEAPISFYNEKLDKQVLKYFKLKPKKKVNLLPWKKITKTVLKTKRIVNIGIIGKYVNLKDAYKSLDEALIHGGISNNVKVNLFRIESDKLKPSQINKVLKGSGRYGQDKDGSIIFNEYVTRPFLFAVLAMDCGLEHPESRDLLSGLEGNKDEFRILNEKERSRLLKINEKHSRDFLKNAVLHQRDRFLKTRKAYRKDQCERFNDFCLQIYDSIYDYSSLIGNSAKASQIYASVVMCTKREYRKLEAVQATKIIKEHVRRRDINIKVATIFFKLFGSFPQGFGIACILGDHYKSSTPFEYAIVNRLYPDDVNSPHCRIVTRSLSFDLGVRDMVITPEMNLLFPQGRSRVGKRLSDNVKAALVKLSGRKITDADEMLVPKFWEPHTIYASRKFSIWNGLNYDGKSAADKPTNTADTA